MGTSRASLAGPMLVLLIAACAGRPSQDAANLPAAPAGGDAAVAGALRFLADDPSAALAEAKRRGVPVFVEAWAPW